VEEISETDSAMQSAAKQRENIPYPSKDRTFSSESSRHLLFDVNTRTTGELPFVAEFHENDNKILSLLNQRTGSYYSFKGLMRKLNLHQQSLARALYRLEVLGVIQRSVNGYRLNESGQKNAQSVKGIGSLEMQRPSEYQQLLQTYIPPGIQAEEIVQKLNGRWFSKIRWIGLVETGISYILQWINDDNTFQINVRIMWDHIIIETNAISDRDKIEAMVGSCRIFEQITKLLEARLRGHSATALN
jgi:DNA-binding HxlR family transcriptional regulator